MAKCDAQAATRNCSGADATVRYRRRSQAGERGEAAGGAMIPPTRSSITPERRVWVVGAGRGSQCGAVAIAPVKLPSLL